jgi:hypothetical protein
MTDTEAKLKDAEVQLGLARNHADDDEIFHSCINAVIEMGRSVTLVMQKDSGQHAALGRWYDERMAELLGSEAGPLLKFFNARRVYTVHLGVVRPQKHLAKVTGSTAPGVKAGDTAILWRFEGTKEYLGPNDSGEVISRSTRYLSILRELVAGWLQTRKELGIDR